MNSGPGPRRAAAAFSLLEVMIAIAIFFMVAFALLELVRERLDDVLRHAQRAQPVARERDRDPGHTDVDGRLHGGGRKIRCPDQSH